MADISISSEEDLWRLFENLIGGVVDTQANTVSVAWRLELLRFPDATFGHAVSPSIARSISQFHKCLARSYALVCFGQPNAQVLRREDREVLDLILYVGEGSNYFEIDAAALERLVNGMLRRMTGKQISISVVVLLILFFSSIVAKEWVHTNAQISKQQIDANERIRLSEQETQRMQLVTGALTANQNLAPLRSLSSESKEPLVRSVIGSGRARVIGAEITEDDARTILAKPREKGIGKRVDGIFEVVEIDVENADGWMGTLKNRETQEHFRVSINLSEIPQEDIDVLFEALRSKGDIEGLANGWFVGDKLISASIVRANRRRN